MTDPALIILYTTPNGAARVEVMIRNETVWLTQKALAELFAVKVPAIAKHLANIFTSKELDESTTVSKMETVRQEGNPGPAASPFMARARIPCRR